MKCSIFIKQGKLARNLAEQPLIINIQNKYLKKWHYDIELPKEPIV